MHPNAQGNRRVHQRSQVAGDGELHFPEGFWGMPRSEALLVKFQGKALVQLSGWANQKGSGLAVCG